MGQIRPDRLKIKGGVRLTSGVEDFNHESHDIHEKGYESGQTHRDFRWVAGSKVSKAVHSVKQFVSRCEMIFFGGAYFDHGGSPRLFQLFVCFVGY